jgi:hypothetical protein
VSGAVSFPSTPLDSPAPRGSPVVPSLGFFLCLMERRTGLLVCSPPFRLVRLGIAQIGLLPELGEWDMPGRF